MTRLAWGSDEEVIRRRAFGEDTGSALEPRMDGRGSPLLIEEDDPTRTTGYTYQQVTGYLSSDTRNSLTQTYAHSGRWGDRLLRETGADPANGATDTSETYSYDTTTFRLAQAQEVNLSTSATTTRTYSYGPGGEVTEIDTDSRPLSLCYDSKAQVAAVVGPGGQYARQVFNFRRQRVREEWPVNGLVTDYWVGTNGALLVEAGAASLTAQYPRPVWEYVYVGGQPVARVDSTETQGGTTSYHGSSFLFGGHLGELLLEADEAGHVVRSYDYTAFGAREAQPAPTQAVGLSLSRTGLPAAQVLLPAPASVTLRFENFSLAPCDSVVVLDEENNVLRSLTSSNPSSFETPALPAQGSALVVWLQQGACAGSSSLTLAEVKPAWGRAQQTVLTGHQYTNPAVGFFVSFSVPPNSHLLVEKASCHTVQVRQTSTQQVLWTWPASTSFFNMAWTPALSGDVEVGITSTLGCGFIPPIFAIRRMHTLMAPGAPANLHLPGQRTLTAATSTRRGAFGDPEPTLLENWHRTYDPSIGRYLQPEPLMNEAAKAAMDPVFGYGKNSPLLNTDPTGLFVVEGTCTNWAAALELAREAAGCNGKKNDNTCECRAKLPCDICYLLEDGRPPKVTFGTTGLYPVPYFGFITLRHAAGETHISVDLATGKISVKKILFWDALCNDTDLVEDLARTIIHESSHACSMFLTRVIHDPLPDAHVKACMP